MGLHFTREQTRGMPCLVIEYKILSQIGKKNYSTNMQQPIEIVAAKRFLLKLSKYKITSSAGTFDQLKWQNGCKPKIFPCNQNLKAGESILLVHGKTDLNLLCGT